MQPCVFCSVAQDKTKLVYDDGAFVAFLDIKPRALGHVLVVPKAHARWVWDVTDIAGYFAAVTKVARALRSAFETDIVVSVIAGDEVEHAHVHLIPRSMDDPLGAGVHVGPLVALSAEEMDAARAKVRGALGA